MSPGPKKQMRAEGKKGNSNIIMSQKVDNEVSEMKENGSHDFEVGGKKYKKRQIVSNIHRYEEPVVDSHADVSRGSDYEVLLSYSGGAGSQHRFSEEKEWEDSGTTSLTLDFTHLSESLKCIPFYKRLHLSKDVFEPSHIIKMDKSAEQNRESYLLKKSQFSVESQQRSVFNPLKQLDSPAHDTLQVDKDYSAFAIVKTPTPAVMPDIMKTLERLTSSLTLDNKSQTETKSVSKTETVSAAAANESYRDHDLDALLSLNANFSELQEASGNIRSGITDANIDEFLNSIR